MHITLAMGYGICISINDAERRWGIGMVNNEIQIPKMHEVTCETSRDVSKSLVIWRFYHYFFSLFFFLRLELIRTLQSIAYEVIYTKHRTFTCNLLPIQYSYDK